MKKLIVFISLVVFTLAFAAPSSASDCSKKKGKGFNGHFGDMDLNGDDQVSMDEFKTHFPHATDDTFKGIDENKDNAIDHDEWHEFKDHHGYGHKHED